LDYDYIPIYKNYVLYLNSTNTTNENTINFKYKLNKKDNSVNINKLKSELFEDNIIKEDSISDKTTIYHYQLKNLEKLILKDILNYYDYRPYFGDNLAVVYYYLYFKNKFDNKMGKFSNNFIDKYKTSSTSKTLKKYKNLFRQRIKNYNIGIDNKLKKFIDIKDKYNNESKRINLNIDLLKKEILY